MENLIISEKVDYAKIEKLKNDIKKMSKNNHIEVLRILKNNKTSINENKNGIFINMSELNSEIISELEKYVDYVLKQSTSTCTNKKKLKKNFTMLISKIKKKI